MFAQGRLVFLVLAGIAAMVWRGAALGATQQPPGAEIQGISSARVSDFSETGSTVELVRKLVRSMSMQEIFEGTFGLENVENSPQRFWLAANGRDVATLVNSICKQDKHVKVMSAEDPRIINLMAADDNSPGRDILQFKLPSIDIETDITPEDLIVRLPEYSAELNTYLLNVYKRNGGSEEGGQIASGIRGNARLPHFSLHLKDVTVRQALNAIAGESFRLYMANGKDPRMVSGPNDLIIWPTGWEFHFVKPIGVPYHVWLHEIFRVLN